MKFRSKNEIDVKNWNQSKRMKFRSKNEIDVKNWNQSKINFPSKIEI